MGHVVAEESAFAIRCGLSEQQGEQVDEAAVASAASVRADSRRASAPSPLEYSSIRRTPRFSPTSFGTTRTSNVREADDADPRRGVEAKTVGQLRDTEASLAVDKVSASRGRLLESTTPGSR